MHHLDLNLQNELVKIVGNAITSSLQNNPAMYKWYNDTFPEYGMFGAISMIGDQKLQQTLIQAAQKAALEVQKLAWEYPRAPDAPPLPPANDHRIFGILNEEQQHDNVTLFGLLTGEWQ